MPSTPMVMSGPWEVYFTDPASEPDPVTWRTEIIQPYRAA